MTRITEEEYREALEIWLSDNPDKTVNDIKNKEIVQISSGKSVKIGMKICRLKQILKGNIKTNLDSNQYEFWVKKHGLNARDKYTEEEYREALEIWLKKNPTKNINNISSNEIVLLPSGKTINLGYRINNMRKVFNGTRVGNLSDEQRKYWVEKHELYLGNKVISKRNISEKKYREALEIWLNNNPKKTINDIKREDVVILETKEEVKLGIKIVNMRQTVKNNIKGGLDDEQKNYWISRQGLDVSCKYKDEEYREALEIWLRDNKGKTINDIKQKEIVKLPSGKDIRIGLKISKIKLTLTGKRKGKINEEQKEYWIKKHGLSLESKKHFFSEKEYRAALEKWISNNPNQNINNIKSDETVTLDNGKKINLGIRINNLRNSLKNIGTIKIDKDQIIYWVIEHGLKKSKKLKKIDNELLEHVLSYLNLNSSSIINNIDSKNINVEEAIGYDIFNSYNIQDNLKLQESFYYFLKKAKKTNEEDLSNLVISLADNFFLSKDEFKTISNMILKYISIIKKYRIIDVGLEMDENIRNVKIEYYNLDESEIEESLFAPLKLDKNIFNNKIDFYLRRNYIMNWSNYSEEEKRALIFSNYFSDYELNYINKIDTKNKILVKSNKQDKK